LGDLPVISASGPRAMFSLVRYCINIPLLPYFLNWFTHITVTNQKNYVSINQHEQL
jgi:hypothetical protein